MAATCSIPDCQGGALTRGWCRPHYRRWIRHGDPTAGGPRRMRGDDLVRLLSKAHKTDHCWIFTGQINNKGYGLIWFRGSKRAAHVVAYELLVGPIPTGLELDHLCRNTKCIRPEHLEPVTHAENQRRLSLAQTHCRRAGHAYTADNTYREPVTGRRRCRTCARIADARRAPRRKGYAA